MRPHLKCSPVSADVCCSSPCNLFMSELLDPEIFRTVLDALQTGVSVADRNGKILFWNQGAERLTGHKRHEVVGRSCRDNILLQCDDQGCIACGGTCPITSTLHEGKPQEAKMQLRHKEGYPVHVLMRAAPLRDPHGSSLVSSRALTSKNLPPSETVTGTLWPSTDASTRPLASPIMSSLNSTCVRISPVLPATICPLASS